MFDLFNKLKSKLKDVTKENHEPAKIRIQCNDLDIPSDVVVEEFGGIEIFLKCPVCRKDFSVSSLHVNKTPLHDELHTVTLISGVLRPRRVG